MLRSLRYWFRRQFGFKFTERDAWLELASWWQKPIPGKVYTDNYTKVCSGLCNCLYALVLAELISGETWESMQSKIREEITSGDGSMYPYMTTLDEKGAQERYEFCLDQALICYIKNLSIGDIWAQ